MQKKQTHKQKRLFTIISSGFVIPVKSLTVHTGSTIRNWHKVKTWLDQMFWQTHQKLMLSGFLSSGKLCQINHLNFFDLTWPQRAPTEKKLKFNMSFHDSVKKYFVSKHQNKVIFDLKLLNTRTWKTLKSTVLIFQALETFPASFNNDLSGFCNLIVFNIL